MDKNELVHLRATEWLEEVTDIQREASCLRSNFFFTDNKSGVAQRQSLSIGLLAEDRSFLNSYEKVHACFGKIQSLYQRIANCHDVLDVGPLIAFRLQMIRVYAELEYVLVSASVQQGITSTEEVAELLSRYDAFMTMLTCCIEILEPVAERVVLDEKLHEDLTAGANNTKMDSSFPYLVVDSARPDQVTIVGGNDCTRSEFAKLCGMQPSTISAIVLEKRKQDPKFQGPIFVEKDGEERCDFFKLAEFVFRNTPPNKKRRRLLVAALKARDDVPRDLQELVFGTPTSDNSVSDNGDQQTV